jgi:hypothetical protein
MRRLVPIAVLLSFAVTWSATPASAQLLGTFRWQQLPYCNVIVVRVVQAGAVFQLDGVDDQCGSGTQASAVGLAFVNPSGSIGIGLTIVTPGGAPLHIDAAVSLPSASGTWHDSAGGSGAFTLTPGPAVPGSPRPAAKAVFPGGVSAGGTPVTDVGTPVAASDAATKGYVDGATAIVRQALIGEKTWKAFVASNGLKFGTGPYTCSRVAGGDYLVTFDLTGLSISNSNSPVVTVTPNTAGAIFATVSNLTTTEANNQILQVTLHIRTFNFQGTPTDVSTMLSMTMTDSNTGSPLPPLDGAGRRCITDGELTRCTYGG